MVDLQVKDDNEAVEDFMPSILVPYTLHSQSSPVYCVT